ncbi:MAG: bifunctional diguanylate cyclase/phosphodiesterase, partial [Actinobacteria bacterium]|nr:bifunctional diguanylate cyclase/phosphodiesterase [Actinomycetota bacterium]
AAALILHRRSSPTKLAFNLAMHYLETVVALAFFRGLLGGRPFAGLVGMGLILGAHALSVILSASMVTVAIWFNDRRRTLDEIAYSMVGGIGVSMGAALVALLLLVAARDTIESLVVIAAAVAMLYGALRVFGALSNRYEQLRSVHAFSTAVNIPTSETEVAATTFEHLARTLQAGIVEVASTLQGHDGVIWHYARLEDGNLTRRMSGSDASELEMLMSLLIDHGGVVGPQTGGAVAGHLARRGLGKGLAFGFESGPVRGMIAVGDRLSSDGVFGSADHSLFETLAIQAATNLERTALMTRLQREIDTKEWQRLHDELTGLLNRVAFTEQLAGRLDSGARSLAVAIIDLDRFQDINDLLGHANGDVLLQEVAKRLRTGIRSEDVLARMSGDEFAVLFDDVREPDAVMALARRVSQSFADPFVVNGVNLTVAASTGMALHPDHGADAGTLLRHADMAMHAAKAARRSIEVYDLAQDLATERRLMLANDLSHAVSHGGLAVAYQPKVEMADGRTMGFEALARWEHPDLGSVSPVEFIPLAEHTGVIVDLTARVLDVALADVARWRTVDRRLTVSVNVPPSVLADPGFSDRVKAALRRHEVPAEALILEVTESEALIDDRDTTGCMVQLAAAGVMFSVDDFGTGYSSLSYLQNLPLGEVKIDRSLIMRIADHPGDLEIVSATVRLMQTLGLRVVAEGVETAEVWSCLAGLDCYAVQGYLVSKPLPADQADEWVASPGWRLADLGVV